MFETSHPRGWEASHPRRVEDVSSQKVGVPHPRGWEAIARACIQFLCQMELQAKFL